MDREQQIREAAENSPEPPIHLDSEEATAWSNGWESGFIAGADFQSSLPKEETGDEDELWGFYYCPMIWESAPALISLHRFKENAEKAMNIHKEFERKQYEQHDEQLKKSIEFGKFENWFVQPIKVKD